MLHERQDNKGYEETFTIDQESKYSLKGCPNCNLIIDEVVYVIDTIYGVTVYFNEDEENSMFVNGNDLYKFEIPEYGVTGTMKISIF